MIQRVHVDRLEGDRAVLVCGPSGTETAYIPVHFLPAGTKEGDALDLTLSTAKEDTVKDEVEGLLGELFADDAPQN